MLLTNPQCNTLDTTCNRQYHGPHVHLVPNSSRPFIAPNVSVKGSFHNIILYARRRSCFRISIHRGGVANTARQASSASASASKLLDEESNERGQHKWRCLRANVATKERECKALKERIAAIEKRVATGELFW